MNRISNDTRKIHVSCFILWLVLCMIPAAGQTPVKVSRPDPDKVSTKVSISIHVIDILQINDIEQLFTIDFALRMSWQDRRLANKPGIYALTDVWHPAIAILNQHGINKQLDDFVTVDTNGNVWYGQRFYGDLTSTLTLRDFPFDSHSLRVVIASAYYAPDEVEFVAGKYGAGLAEDLSLAGWTVDREAKLSTKAYWAGNQTARSEIDLEIKAQRQAGFYIWRVIVPLLLIVFMSWAVFFIDPAELGPQVSISVSSILSVIALQFTFVGILPKVSYLTRLDRFILGSTILIFLALVESVITSALTTSNKHKLVRKIDRGSRVIFPVALILLSIFCL